MVRMRSRLPGKGFLFSLVACGLCLLLFSPVALADGGTIYADYSNSGFFDGVSTLLATLAPAVVLMAAFAAGALLLVYARRLF